MKITEPMTMVTDYLIAIEASIFAILLFQNGRVQWGVAYFALLAIGSMLGGTTHGFKPYFSPKMESKIWKGTLVTLGLTSYALVIAITQKLFNSGLFSVSSVFLLGLVWYFIRVKNRGIFLDAILYYGVSMVYIFGLTLFSYIGDPSSGKGYIITSLVILGVATAVQVKKVAFHKHFNHNDLFHVISMVAFWFLYEGMATL